MRTNIQAQIVSEIRNMQRFELIDLLYAYPDTLIEEPHLRPDVDPSELFWEFAELYSTKDLRVVAASDSRITDIVHADLITAGAL